MHLEFCSLYTPVMYKSILATQHITCESTYHLESAKLKSLRPPHHQRIQALNPKDYTLRLNFCHWVLQQCAFNRTSQLMCYLHTSRLYLRDSVANSHSFPVLATNNSHATRSHAHKNDSLNVWADIVKEFLNVPYLEPNRLSRQCYLIFLE